MKVPQVFKRIAGGAIAVAALLALTVPGTANAASITIDPTKTTTLTIKGTNRTLAGHRFKAVRLAAYSEAQATGADLTSVSVTSSLGLATGLAAAYNVANSGPIDAAHSGNVMSAVAEKWLGFDSAASSTNIDETSNSVGARWTGELRNFVTSLVNQPDVQAAVTASLLSATGPTFDSANPDVDDTVVFPAVPQGIYLVVDVTGTPPSGPVSANPAPATIPILVSSALRTASTTYDHFLNDELIKLGEVDMKNNVPTIKKKLTSPTTGSAAVGDTLTYQIIASMPLTTGFTHYTYKITDVPEPGLTFVSLDSVVVSPSELGGVTTTLSSPSQYTVTTPTNPGDSLIINLSPGIISLSETYPTSVIRIQFKMKINNDATSSTTQNGVKLAYSNDTRTPPSNNAGDDTGLNGTVSIINNTDPGTQVYAYFYQFTLDVQAKIDPSTKLSGATFFVYDPADPTNNTKLKFMKLGPGNYKKVADDTTLGGNIVDTLVSSDGSNLITGVPLGRLKVDGLKANAYTVHENTVPVGYSNAFASEFTVTFDIDGSHSAAEPEYSNSDDAWHLVNEAYWPYTDAASHLIPVQEVTSFSQLPMTGGAGAIVVGLVVIVLLGVAGALFIITRRGEKSLNQEG
ncbi:isopeptide-forming domain-containing fimbrial protein [Bifidobacterium sp. ESL0775]|uniref:isopeptide-forming domain-containing fimbrial protein n=1 Tax=Bifidobacterium sp. ESL0775 TaxID=2983230 RepID=UPI0023F777C9|nr:isopeptide-forming domain-containing fimbrial protein [Bifidobacterium sp. ESL0775]WEV69830.1 isopeptide-forming domain-containing fimbrial protein [Bifidobacterium sp. ESL0775]